MASHRLYSTGGVEVLTDPPLSLVNGGIHTHVKGITNGLVNGCLTMGTSTHPGAITNGFSKGHATKRTTDLTNSIVSSDAAPKAVSQFVLTLSALSSFFVKMLTPSHSRRKCSHPASMYRRSASSTP